MPPFYPQNIAVVRNLGNLNKGHYQGIISCSVFPIRLAVVQAAAELCTVFQTKVITRTKQSEKSHEFSGGIVLDHSFNKGANI